jgi:hypothetical protein
MSSGDAVTLICVLSVYSLLIVAQHVRARRILSRWAAREGLRIVSREMRCTRSGPFTGRHRQGQFVFKVAAVDASGAARTGWVRIGHPLTGVLSEALIVVWD